MVAQTFTAMPLPNVVAILVSIFLMAATVAVSARMVLRVRPWPYAQALVIAAVSNVLGKVAVSILHWPAAVSYTVPTLAYFGLSIAFFKPSPRRLVPYWVTGFAMYLLIHVVISRILGWTFMFPFWVPWRKM